MSKYLVNSNSIQQTLQFPLQFFYEDAIEKDDISRTVKEVVEGVNIFKYIDFSHRNAYGYDAVKMLECVILAFSLYGYASTRKLEDLCKYDIRFQFIMSGQTPSHMAFQRFIHDDLMMPIEEIFVDINKYIEEHDQINTDILYIDGTKFEANANKMTFVWMNATKKYAIKRWAKIMQRLIDFNNYCSTNAIPVKFSILKEVSVEYLLEIIRLIEMIMNEKNIVSTSGKGKRKHVIQRYKEAFQEDLRKIYKYTTYYEIAKGRNSFSKTDYDATFMHMKYDYYNNTNVFKPGYNVQIGSSEGYIRHVYISSDGNDLNTYIPFMNGYHKAYGTFPSMTPADAGYGSFDNYKFCKEQGIGLYMKYGTYRKELAKVTDENRFKSFNMKRDEDGDIICPAGHKFTLIKSTTNTKGQYPKEIKTYVNNNCANCPLRDKCTKSKSGRSLKITEELVNFQTEVKENLSTDFGKQLMKNRSVQAEGIFGQIKQDNQYDRLRRRGITGVKLELLLVCIGHNLRKFHTRKFSIQS